MGFATDFDSRASQPLYPEKNSSGESSNAEKWFENSNNNVKTRAAAVDDSKIQGLMKLEAHG